MKEFQGTDRFVVRRCLGIGGFGAVYEVYDRERKTVLALKTLRQTDPSALYFLKKEFRSLADVTHQNLVTLYELFSDGNLWFFTMELIEGINFLDYVRGTDLISLTSDEDQNEPAQKINNIQSNELLGADEAITLLTPLPVQEAQTIRTPKAIFSTGKRTEVETIKFKDIGLHNPALIDVPKNINKIPFHLDRLISALKQLVAGISAIHEAGKLHCDIKPSNVLVTKEGRLVILDFGLATETNTLNNNQKVDIVGTPAYMSPEQGLGQQLTPAADWYSLGVMLFQVLTARFPFGGDLVAMMKEKKNSAPPSPLQVVPDIPDYLAELCQALLNPNPAKRADRQDILHYLGETEQEHHHSTLSPLEIPLIGRATHLAALNQAYQDMRSRCAVTIFVHGRSGMGKSMLVRRFLDEIKLADAQTVLLSGCCYQQESVPYKALDSVIDALSQYLRALPKKDVPTLLPEDILALARLFPVLEDIDAIAKSERKVLDIPDSQEFRRRAFTALKELLFNITQERSLIIFIDDLQWGDLDSAALLGEILRPPNPPALLLIGTYRSEEKETSTFLKTFCSSQNIIDLAIDLREISVEELSLNDAQNLALAISSQKLSTSKAAAIARESGGSPFFISELALYANSDNEDLETTLKDVIQARVAQLPQGARQLLEIVAVAGQPLPRNLIAESATDKLLALLRATHMIRTTAKSIQEEIETYHDRIRETIITNLDAEQLRLHHQYLAQSLENSSQADVERLTIHFQGAGDNEKAAKYALIAADQAANAFAFDRAAELYQLVLKLKPLTIDEAQLLRTKLATALVNAGRSAQAAQINLDLANNATTNFDAIEYERKAAEQLLLSGHINEGLPVLRKVLNKIGIKLPATPLQSLCSFLISRTKLKLRGLKFKEHASHEISDIDRLRMDSCCSASVGLFMPDVLRSLDFQTRFLLLALNAGELTRILKGLTLEASYTSMQGNRQQKRISYLLQLSNDIAIKLAQPYPLALVMFTKGVTAHFKGDWINSREYNEKAEKMFREQCTGASQDIDSTYLILFDTLYFLGELKEIARRVPTIIKEVQERNNLYVEIYMRTLPLCRVLLANDEPERALQETVENIGRWSQQGYHMTHFLALCGHVDAILYTGDGVKAWHTVQQHWPALMRSSIRRVQISLIYSSNLHARSALTAAINGYQTNALLKVVDQDIKIIEKERTILGNGLALLLRVGLATIRGKQNEILPMLESAQELFQNASMKLYAAVIRRQRGKLIGGKDGQRLIDSAESWMHEQNIKNFNGIHNMLLPGKW